MNKYNPQTIEKYWQRYWEKNKTFQTKESDGCPKYYVLDMFPYPSGAGLHVGHPKGYIATDIVARMKMMQGHNVLHPMGWDAFGLPAENYALKNKLHPATSTENNIKVFKKQLGLLGFTYDWDREVNTTDPAYYRWTQWMFLEMYKRGLVFESNEPINWCPSCKTGLANEDLDDGKCERCGSEVEQKPMRQWVIKITDYAERLLNDIEKLTAWPEPIKEMQRNWIGKSEGALVRFAVSPSFQEGVGGVAEVLEVFTTRPDTLFGCTYCVVAPEHSIINNEQLTINNRDEINKYVVAAKNKTVMERTELAKEKTGIEIKGIKAVNPVNGEQVPIFVADYVLGSYGTGAIMAVPAHDERDFEMANKFNLPIKQVVAPLYAVAQGPDAVRPDKKTIRRRTAYAIVKHWKEDKYLCLDWTKYNWHSGIIGGVETGENMVEAAKREIAEETSYLNFKFVRSLGGEIHNNFFAGHKDENRYAEGFGMLFELENEERGDMNVEHSKYHEIVWIEGKKMNEWLNLPVFSYMWNILSGASMCFDNDGVSVNSDFLNGLKTSEAKQKMIAWLEEKKIGQKKVNYKLRDWVFSRQRYWGEPIPLIKCAEHGWVPVPEEELPLELPKVKQYEPSGTGESPLATIDKWVNTKCPVCGGPAKRETNTMPQWAGSCWYYLAYCLRKGESGKWKGEYEWDKDKLNYWMGIQLAPRSPSEASGEGGVDFYVGGAEHATRHLIYARFWHKFLFDIGMVGCEEPFTRLQNLGVILAEDGRKMSKRWNNVINPDDIVAKFGADAMRLYEMFMGPFDQPCAWSTQGVVGMRRFLEKVWAVSERVSSSVILSEAKDPLNSASRDSSTALRSAQNDKLANLLHKTIKKVTEDIGEMRFNTAIAQMMMLVNEMSKEEKLQVTSYKLLLQILSPFAPHICEELWANLGNKNIIITEPWPKYDPALIQDSEITLAVQVNGKLRDTIVVSADISEDNAKQQALSCENVKKWLEGKEPKKVIYVKGRLVSIVV